MNYKTLLITLQFQIGVDVLGFPKFHNHKLKYRITSSSAFKNNCQ